MRVTLKQIADAGGVSLMTASRALRGVGRVDEQTRQRLREIARRMGHPRMDRVALHPPLCQGRTERKLRVLLVMFDPAEIESEIGSEFAAGLRDALKKINGKLQFVTCASLEDIQSQWEKHDAQALVLRQRIPSKWVMQLRKTGPVVYAASYDSQTGVDCVYTNEHRSAASILDLLTSHGHQCITWLGIQDRNVTGVWPRTLFDEGTTMDRLSSAIHGVRHAAWANLVYGSTPENGRQRQSLMLMVRDWKKETLAQTVEREIDGVLAQKPRPTAIVVSNDPLGVEVLKALQRRGIRVPEDMSLIGYGAIREGRTAVPPLTSVSLPMRELGRVVPELIDRRIANPEALPLSLQFETKLRPGGTVGPCPTSRDER